MRRLLLLLALCLFCLGTACADGTRTGIIWPGWRVETTEDYDGPGYPISNLFDGSARTAWVHHFAPDPKSFSSLPRNPTPHGVGATVSISRDVQYHPQQYFTVDSLGIINGYGKDRETYLRNNRIRAIRVHLQMTHGSWGKTFSLIDSLQVQRISFPRQQVSMLSVEVVKVDQGKDDDLCISELVLYHHDKPIPWQITPVVLYNRQNDCGCGGLDFSLMTAGGRPCPKEFSGADRVMGVAFQPSTRRMLLSTQHAVYYYDFATRTVLYQHTFSHYVTEVVWTDARTALFATSPKIYEGPITAYRFSAETKTLQSLRRAPAKFHSVSGYWPPEYGA